MPVSSPEGGTLCSCTHIPFLLNSLLKMPSLSINFVFDIYKTTVNQPEIHHHLKAVLSFYYIVFQFVSVSQLIPPLPFSMNCLSFHT